MVRGITSLDDIASLRDMYERMFRFRIGLAEGNLFDLTSAGPDVNEITADDIDGPIRTCSSRYLALAQC